MSKRFDPNSLQWTVVYRHGGLSGTLQVCLDELFSDTDYSGTRQLNPESYKEFKDNCLKYGYASVNGWTVYYETVEGESSLIRNQITPKPGYIYVVHAINTDRYKIGKSVNPNNRLVSLSKQAPYKLKLLFSFAVQDMSKAEKQLHQYFIDKQVNSEWFQLSNDDIEYLKSWSRSY
ncbi:hypothetical protein FACHB389_31500 [Nostoc calcicola FACHB-389]|nr:GIY-YIG nuclease family protein [Nostoc calcicola FACHB-3891]OKH21667.1 hypothetical protein FACHB389_31500 [Nostoc calcicola FACHB-389]